MGKNNKEQITKRLNEVIMKELSLKEIQEIELELLIKFKTICERNNLRYSLGGGSLLGSIRHKGFIPWDDDIDVMMPRPDYEKFLTCSRNSDIPFKLITYDIEKGYNGLFAKIWNPETVIIDDLMELDYEIGVNIDIFPIDGLGNNKQEALKIFRKTTWNREMLNAALWKRFFRSKTHSIFIEPIRFTMFILSRFANPKELLRKIDEENFKHPFDESAFAGCVCGSYREKEIMPKVTFTNYIDNEFEGYRFKVIANYDEYLTMHYGNYMEIPPKEKQQTHHTYKAYKK